MNSLDAIIHKKIKIEYYDHNDVFGELLPVEGEIEGRYITENVNDWYLIKIDKPFEYEGKRHEVLLVRSKWQGEVINERE